MPTKVIIVDVAIGTGEKWRNVTSRRPLTDDHDHVRIDFLVSIVACGRDMVEAALERLQKEGDITSYRLGTINSPEVVCTPGLDVVRAIHRSGKAGNAFTIGLRNKLQRLLEIGPRHEGLIRLRARLGNYAGRATIPSSSRSSYH